MSIISNGLSSGAPEMAAVPTNKLEAERALLGKPLTLGYRPQLPGWTASQYLNGFADMQMQADVEAMLRHPHVQEVYGQYKAGITHAEFKVKATSPEIAKFVDAMIRRFWERSLDVAQGAYDYGWGGFEVNYTSENGYLTFQHMDGLSPFDCWALTRNHHYAGVSVNNVPGAEGKALLWGPSKWPAKGFWFAHNKRWNKWYGRSQLLCAWRPWRRVGGRDGLEECLDGAWYRFGYRGPVIRYPLKAYPKRGTSGESCDSTDYDVARESARQFAEQAKAGVSLALPNTRDAKGEYEWVLENMDPAPISLGGLLDVVKQVLGEIAYGIGVPPELLEASEVGSGWSGRKVPMLVFYTRMLRNARALVWAWTQQIGLPLVRWNFGKGAKFEIEVSIKPPQELEPIGQGGQGQGGPQPPPPDGQGQDQQQPQQPLPFQQSQGGGSPPASAAAAPPPPPGKRPYKLAAAAASNWGDVIQQAHHLRIVGESGSGKTTVAQALGEVLPGQLLVIDPVYEPGTWGGLPAVKTDAAGGYGPIKEAMDGLLAEMGRRGELVQQGRRDEIPPLTILWDEVPDTVSEVKDAGLFLRRIAQRGRHEKMKLIGIGQSSRVGSWGLEGFGDVSENFATLYLGGKAVEQDPSLAGAAPFTRGVLEYQGTKYPVDLTAMLELSKQAIPPERAFHLPPAPAAPSAPVELSDKEIYAKYRAEFAAMLSTAWTSADHPRGQPENAGEFAKKGDNGGMSHDDTGKYKGEPVTLTLWRHADDGNIVGSASFAASRKSAEAYKDNPGFGGETLYKSTVDINPKEVLDLYDLDEADAIKKIRKITGLRHPGAIGPDEWIPRIASQGDEFRDAGIEWVRVRESHPVDSETWIFVGSDDPEMDEV